MNPTIWIWIFLPLFIMLFTQYQTQKRENQRHILKAIKSHKKKGGADVGEVIKRFIGKECIITIMNENVIGIIEAMEDNWIVISSIESGTKDGTEIINTDYISRIREYPKNKKGKKKLIVV